MTDQLTKLQTALAGRYAVVRDVGAGGMATVYLARDVKHDRHVALKVLRPELGAVLGVERFLSEIKVTAHLQHPHLLPLFDSGEAEGLLFYVMPYVEGESLRVRLDREHQLPIDEALRIATAVASALDYAHRQNVIHRDLKPENILLQHGEPVVSDFGIALAVSNAGGARITQTGLSLGTPQYMSPEQATGDREVDARSDIYSLAAVLYEMLSGEPPHAGRTAQAIIARVLTEKPHSVRVTRDTVPEHMDAALLKALAKLPADRFATAGEFVAALKAPVGATTTAAHGLAGPASRTDRWWWSRARGAVPWAIAALAVGALALSKVTPPAESARVIRFNTTVPREVRFGPSNSPLAVSPDGSAIVVGSMIQANIGLFIRALDNPQFVPIPGTAEARSVFFSPDGSEIGFVAGEMMKVVPRGGGTVRTLATVPGLRSWASWSDRGEIAFTNRQGQLWIAPAAGGNPRLLASPDSSKGELEYLTPHFLPGGDVALFSTLMRDGTTQLATVTRTGQVTRLAVAGASPQYTQDGRIFVDDLAGGVLSAGFDARRLTLTSPPALVLDGVAQRGIGLGVWTVSPGGTLVHVGSTADGTLAIVNRSGVAAPITAEVRRYRRPMVSPDGGRVVVEIGPGVGAGGARSSSATTDLWMLNLSAGTMSRFTFGATAMDPAWTRDGRRVAFARLEAVGGAFDVYWQLADGSGAAEPLYEGPGSQWPYAFSADGRTMIVDESPGGGAIRIAAVPVSGTNRVTTPLFESPFANRLVRLSTDDRWITYASNESGRTEVYVRPFPGPGGKWQVSTDGGDQPLWHPNGREIFYRTGTKVMVASVTTAPTFAVTARRELFDDVYEQAGTLNWDVFPDGNRFVMVRSATGDPQLSVTINWPAALRSAAGPTTTP